jgi:hypothetical protein
MFLRSQVLCVQSNNSIWICVCGDLYDWPNHIKNLMHILFLLETSYWYMKHYFRDEQILGIWSAPTYWDMHALHILAVTVTGHNRSRI